MDLNGLVVGEQSAFALADDSVTALDAARGEQQWRTTVSEADGIGLSATSFVADSRLLVCGLQTVAALDTATGAVQWSYRIPGKAETAGVQASAVRDGVAYLGAVNAGTPSFEPSDPYSRIYAVDIETGDCRTLTEFSSQRNPPVIRSLIAGKRYVYADIDDRIVAVRLDGQQRWSADIAGVSTLALRDGTLVVPTETALVAVAADSGKRVWTNGTVHEGIAVGDETVYAPARSGDEPGLTALTLRGGVRKWKTDTAGAGDRPVLCDGVVYLPISRAEDADSLAAFDSDSGCKIAGQTFESAPLYDFAASPEHVFAIVGATQGTLQAYDLPEREP